VVLINNVLDPTGAMLLGVEATVYASTTNVCEQKTVPLRYKTRFYLSFAEGVTRR